MRWALVVLATLSVCAGAIIAEELLSNGGFETGDLTDWSTNAPDQIAALSDTPQEGSYYIQVTGLPEDAGDTDIGLAQTFSLTSGESYTFSGYYRIDQPRETGNWRSVEFGFFDAFDPYGGQPISEPRWGTSVQTGSNSASAVTDWTQFSVEYTPDTTGNMLVGFAVWKTAAIVSIDGLSLSTGEVGLPGDTDGDGDVDLDDLFAVRNNFGTTSGATLADGDTDGDGDVDLDDLFAVRNNFGTGLVVPEPATIGLLALGGALLIRRRR